MFPNPSAKENLGMGLQPHITSCVLKGFQSFPKYITPQVMDKETVHHI